MFEFTRINTKSDHEEDIDLEQGTTTTLYPGISHGENILRWGFIRKVYGILAAQMVLTTLVSFATVLYAPLNEMLRGNSGLLLFMIFLPFLCMIYQTLLKSCSVMFSFVFMMWICVIVVDL